MMASACSPVIVGAVVSVVSSPGAAIAVGAPMPATKLPATTPQARAPIRRRRQFCDVIDPPVRWLKSIVLPICAASLTARRTPGTNSVFGVEDLGADRGCQSLVFTGIRIQVPGVTGCLRNAHRAQRADQRSIGRAERHFGHHVDDVRGRAD